MVTTVVWERLDVPGHDACRLEARDDGWALRGTAVFVAPAGSARVDYCVACGRDWRCRVGRVRGWIAHRAWDLAVTRSKTGEWRVNTQSVGSLGGCLDLDFGFTPATNVLHLRREHLRVGDAADLPVAWLDLPAASLARLPQRYHRRTDTTYWYESPTAKYAAMLEMAASGFAAEYPGLWRLRAEATHPSA
jgi:hypothetical protein